MVARFRRPEERDGTADPRLVVSTIADLVRLASELTVVTGCALLVARRGWARRLAIGGLALMAVAVATGEVAFWGAPYFTVSPRQVALLGADLGTPVVLVLLLLLARGDRE